MHPPLTHRGAGRALCAAPPPQGRALSTAPPKLGPAALQASTGGLRGLPMPGPPLQHPTGFCPFIPPPTVYTETSVPHSGVITEGGQLRRQLRGGPILTARREKLFRTESRQDTKVRDRQLGRVIWPGLRNSWRGFDLGRGVKAQKQSQELRQELGGTPAAPPPPNTSGAAPHPLALAQISQSCCRFLILATQNINRYKMTFKRVLGRKGSNVEKCGH